MLNYVKIMLTCFRGWLGPPSPCHSLGAISACQVGFFSKRKGVGMAPPERYAEFTHGAQGGQMQMATCCTVLYRAVLCCAVQRCAACAVCDRREEGGARS